MINQNNEQLYQQENLYDKRITDDPVAISLFIKKITAAYPSAEIKIEKFTKRSEGGRQVCDVKLSEFIDAINDSDPLGGSIQNERVRSYKNKEFKMESMLEFFVREIYINNEEHCIWIRVSDNEDNRVRIEKMIEEAEGSIKKSV